MPKINVLDRQTAELIAAGEVIERPSSVIKELIENSIDAGSKHITIEIKRGGTTYMRISDDGCGIAFDDVPKAFLRHATSKIVSSDDLENVMTLGFRGEALASVSAVAKVEMRTKQREDEYGTFYSINGSIPQEHEKQGCQDGTSIIVRDLFYNVPARQKFMKKDVSEGNAVSNVTGKIALSHPEISFRFIRDGKTEFTTSGDGDLYSAMYAVYGKAFAKDMIPVNYTDMGITVTGYVVKPLYSRANRSFQNFFVNRRYIKSAVCTVSLEEGYKGLIMTGKFPSCVLMIDIPPSTVDVNAHPAKVEVKFSDEKRVFDCIFFAVKDALYKSGLIYEFQLDKGYESEKNTASADTITIEKSSEEFRNTTVSNSAESDKKMSDRQKISIGLDNFVSAAPEKYDDIPSISPKSIMSMEAKEKIDTYDEQKNEISEQPISSEFKYITTSSLEKKKPEPVCDTDEIYDDFKNSEKECFHVIGEAFGNYIIAETNDKMIMFDKHAGHERIIYEQLKNRNKIMESQFTMNISEVLVSENEFEAVKENTDMLKEIGFEFDFSNPPYLKATAVPIFLDSSYIDEATEEIAHNLYLNKINPQTQIIDDLFHSLACKSAVKSHDKNSHAELQSLAEQIYFNDNIRHCPHGRPVMFILTKKEFEKQFKRIQ
ncbi:MAG: DNA mismatch repair endonuclease MutL [Oscillospiraceae bacterium]